MLQMGGKGWGIVSEVDIQPGAFVMEYTGKLPLKTCFGMCLKGRMLVLKDMMGNLASSFGCQGKFAVIYHQID